MKRLLFILLILPAFFLYGQRIGKLAPEKPPMEFPNNAWGANLMFGDGGFGIGTFLRKSFSPKVSGFIDVSFAESKNAREFEYFDYYGRSIVVGKENRVFLIPLNVGIRYRIFEKELSDNLRPYFSAGVGPTLGISTPFKEEFFKSFNSAKFHFAVGGYVSFGADFGLSKSNLLGLNMRYYYSRFISEGVEHMTGSVKNEIGAFYITLSIGMMY
ncbi:MAG: hypothetical protein L3J41_08110 [Melioribacteraceae bacterium]|nr:hypothetical protein [Melioribacteraceae bacterium]